MDDLARWLENLGLGNYADRRELGLPMGPRKRFMRAVARLSEGEGGPASSAAPATIAC